MFEIHNRALPDSKIFFWILSLADAPEVDPKGTRALLANVVSTFFINGKPGVIIEPRKAKNPPRLIIFLVASLNKTPSFSKNLIIFIISYYSSALFLNQ